MSGKSLGRRGWSTALVRTVITLTAPAAGAALTLPVFIAPTGDPA